MRTKVENNSSTSCLISRNVETKPLNSCRRSNSMATAVAFDTMSWTRTYLSPKFGKYGTSTSASVRLDCSYGKEAALLNIGLFPLKQNAKRSSKQLLYYRLIAKCPDGLHLVSHTGQSLSTPLPAAAPCF